MRSARIWVWRAVGAAALVAALGAPRPAVAQSGQALAKLSLDDGRLSWDGVRLGMSLVQAERKLGVTLALGKHQEPNPCAKFVAEADRGGVRLTVGFASPKPSAKIVWLHVRFGNEQVAASKSELTDEIRARFPGATWVRPANQPDLVEGDDLAPTFEIPGGDEPQAVRLAPREALELAAPGCLG